MHVYIYIYICIYTPFDRRGTSEWCSREGGEGQPARCKAFGMKRSHLKGSLDVKGKKEEHRSRTLALWELMLVSPDLPDPLTVDSKKLEHGPGTIHAGVLLGFSSLEVAGQSYSNFLASTVSKECCLNRAGIEIMI